jgi:hypothetical protein
MAFGKSQFNNPTPSHVNNIVSAISAIAGVLIAWLQTVTFIPDNAVEVISGICGLIIGLSQVVRPFFGVEVTAPQIPTEQVTAIDTKAK